VTLSQPPLPLSGIGDSSPPILFKNLTKEKIMVSEKENSKKKIILIRELNVAEELAIRKIKKAGLSLLAAQAELDGVRQKRQEQLRNLK